MDEFAQLFVSQLLCTINNIADRNGRTPLLGRNPRAREAIRVNPWESKPTGPHRSRSSRLLSGLVAATSTVAVPVGTVVAVVAGETAVGALLGGGAAAASMAYQEGTLFKHSPLVAACTKKIDDAQASGIAKLRAKVSAVYHQL